MNSTSSLPLIRQWFFYVVGVSVLGIGIGLIIGANVGYGPWDIFFSHFVDLFDTSFLIAQAFVSTGLALSGYFIRKEWPNNRLIGMAFNASLTGVWIDITILLQPLPGVFAYGQIVVGVLIVATGINLTRLTMVQTNPQVFQTKLIKEGRSPFTALLSSTMLQLPPMDFLINAMYERLPYSYGVVKQGLDTFILVTSIIMSTLLPLDYKLGIGTIIIIIIIGPSINLTYPILERFVTRPVN
jgi:uncharacterized protein